MGKPLLSVIVPARDQAPFIHTSMRSLARQFDDPADLEVIVVDDGSIDGTGDLVRGYSDYFPRLKILRNDEPVGLASARNNGLAETDGRFIAFLDPDDWLAPKYLPSIVAEIEDLGVDFIRADHVQHDAASGNRSVHRAPEGRRGVSLNPRSRISDLEHSTMIDYVFSWAGVFSEHMKTQGLLEFPDGLRTAEDRPWAWRIHLTAQSYAVSRKIGLFYRRGVVTSLTQIVDERQLDFIRSFSLVFEVLQELEAEEEFWDKALVQFLAISYHHLVRLKGVSELKAPLRKGVHETLENQDETRVQRALEMVGRKRRNTVKRAIWGQR